MPDTSPQEPSPAVGEGSTAATNRTNLGWHWVRADRRLLDGQLVEQGRTYRMDGKPELCQRGFHASERVIDALRYARGPVLCRVQLGGRILRGDDKMVATERTVLWVADVTRTLVEWAADEADVALDLVQAKETPAYGRVRVRLGSGSLASRWKAIERTSGPQCFTFDPEDFAITGFADPMARIAVDVEITEDGHVA